MLNPAHEVHQAQNVHELLLSTVKQAGSTRDTQRLDDRCCGHTTIFLAEPRRYGPLQGEPALGNRNCKADLWTRPCTPTMK